ncbi:hypothetical protein G4B88_013072 [Cannabis sativa]|uniref:Ycf2 N-terminal domain-containing protein n=1 Tax=Cannabis sativa TaxID=3483 RepID=A0A7J6F3D6_CANSA|nr:hypothetical protein G4B88_013072 [Cannabis sativa]
MKYRCLWAISNDIVAGIEISFKEKDTKYLEFLFHEDKPLNDYITWFLEVVAKTKSLSEVVRFMALAFGLKEISPIWSDLFLEAIYTINDFSKEKMDLTNSKKSSRELRAQRVARRIH